MGCGHVPGSSTRKMASRGMRCFSLMRSQQAQRMARPGHIRQIQGRATITAVLAEKCPPVSRVARRQVRSSSTAA